MQPRHRGRGPPRGLRRRGGRPGCRSGCSRWSPTCWPRLGRSHDPGSVRRAVAAARRVGFESFNLDLIYGAVGRVGGGLGPHPRRGARARTAPRERLRPHRGAGHAAGRRPGPPARRRRPGRQVPAGHDPAGRRGAASGTRSPTGPRPGTAAATTSSTGTRATTWGSAAPPTRTAAGRRWWNVRTPERYVEAVLADASTEAAGEHLDEERRRLEALQLALRTTRGVPVTSLSPRRPRGARRAGRGARRAARAHRRRAAARQRGGGPPALNRRRSAGRAARTPGRAGPGRARRGRPAGRRWPRRARRGRRASRRRSAAAPGGR